MKKEEAVKISRAMENISRTIIDTTMKNLEKNNVSNDIQLEILCEINEALQSKCFTKEMLDDGICILSEAGCEERKCIACDGTGKICEPVEDWNTGALIGVRNKTCPACGGDGIQKYIKGE